MPHKGGSSTTSGIRYQNWFLALQIAYCYFEKDWFIFPEPFTDDFNIIDDIKIVQGKRITYFNVKQRAPAENLHWAKSQLISQKVVNHIKQQYEANEKAEIVFVSECNCYLFTEVFVRARSAHLPIHLDAAMESIKCRDLWAQARDIFKYDDLELMKLAKNVSMRCLPLYEIQNLIEHRFVSTGQHKAISKLFLSKSLDYSSGKLRITKEEIHRWLMEEGIDFKEMIL